MPLYVWMFVAGLTANMFAGNWAYAGVPVGLDRPLMLLAIALCLLDPYTDRVRPRAVHGFMLACVGWTFASWMWTGSFADSAKAFALSDRIIVPFAMFVVGPLVFSTPLRRDLLLKALSVGGLYLGATAIGEVFQINVLVWPSYIMDPSLGIQFGRARGPFLASEAMGMTVAMCLLAALVLLLRTEGWWRAVANLSALLSLFAVALSQTRSIWLGSVLALLIMGALIPTFRRKLPVVIPALAGAGVAIFSAFPGIAANLADRLSDQRSIDDRLTTNAAAIRMVENYPAFGVGWGNFLPRAPELVRQIDNVPLTNVFIEVHNVFLSRAVETGVPGAVLWALVAITGPGYVAVRLRRESGEMRLWALLAMGAFAVWIMPTLFSPNPYPLPNNLFWLLCGVAGRSLFVKSDPHARLEVPPQAEART